MILKNLMPLNTPKISHKMSIRYILKKKQKTKNKKQNKNKKKRTKELAPMCRQESCSPIATTQYMLMLTL